MTLKNLFLAASAGMMLSTPAAAQTNDAVHLADGRVMTTEQFNKTDFTADNHLERSGVEASVEWVTRVPERGGYRTESVESLDEALKNPALKDHIYGANIGFQTPLAYAVINNDMGLMDKCLSARVNPDIGRAGAEAGVDAPLAKAVNKYSLLKKQGRDTSVQARQIESLLNAGADPNITVCPQLEQDRETGKWKAVPGDKPLHTMAGLRDNQMIDRFISHGADTTAKSAGKTPADVYNAEITTLSGDKPAWRGEKDPAVVQSLTPKKSMFAFNRAVAAEGR